MGTIRIGWFVATYGGGQGRDYPEHFVDYPACRTPGYESIRDGVILCENLGFDSVWMADHLIFGRDGAILECWTTLAAMASLTNRIRLGSLTLCQSHRHPSVLAKMAATLDTISKGRLNFGIGAGWNKEEQDAYGLKWDGSPAVRICRMEEVIEIAKKMWTEERPSYEGRFFTIKDAVCNPRPMQKPHPPIWIGGGGEKLMLRAVAKHADGWNWSGSVSDFEHKLNVLKHHCSEVRRDVDAIEVSWSGFVLMGSSPSELRKRLEWIRTITPGYPVSIQSAEGDPETVRVDSPIAALAGTPDMVIDRMQEYLDIGVRHFVLYFVDFPSLDGMQLFAREVMPSFK